MLNQAEFDRRIQENTEVYKRQYKNSAFDVTKYHLAYKEKGNTSIPILLKHIHDIYGAVLTGCLPTLTGKGCDAIKMIDGVSSPVELKTSYVTNDNLWSNNGILYTNAPNKRTKSGRKVESQFRAEYHIYGDADSKMIDTTLICMDSLSGELICAYTLPAHEVTDKLSPFNQKACSRTSITLKHFMSHGVKLNTIVEQLGFDNWYKRMLDMVPEGYNSGN